MKILFLCGSLEPGCDGVGDYTRQLAIELLCSGHHVEIVAINEKNLRESKFNSIQKSGLISISTYRLSAEISWKKRERITKSIISQINPELISLQFVPFSFHNKGIPYFLPNWLSKIASPLVKWHIMFHELWVSDSVYDSLKHWLLSELQKAIIKNLLYQFHKPLISTSNLSYYKMLKGTGFEASILPVFSNLPKGRKQALSDIKNRDEKVIGVFFGHLQKNVKFIENVRILKTAIESQLNKQLVIFHIGNNRNPIAMNLINQLTEQMNIQTISLGFLGAQEAADVLYQADIGLSNYPLNLIHKSGSIASMLYNELPVLLLSDNKSTNGISGISEVMPWNEGIVLNGFIDQEPGFAIKYDPKFIAEKLEQKFKDQINKNCPI